MCPPTPQRLQFDSSANRWQTVDPFGDTELAEAPTPLLPLTGDEREAVLSGSGYRPGMPGANAENNPDLAPYRSRGLYPNPGLYFSMSRSNPIIAAGLYKLELTISALPWRIVPPDNPTPLEEEQTEWIRESFARAGGMPALISRIVGSSYQYGFYLSEPVYAIDAGTGWAYTASHVFIEPWQVKKWVLDGRGFRTGQIIASADGDVFLPVERSVHTARRFTGRNYEGESALRSLWYYHEAKRRSLVSDEVTRQRFGHGFPKFKMTPEAGDGDYDKVVELAERFVSGPQSYVVEPPYVTMTLEHGGSVIPDNGAFNRYVDHMIRTVLDDNLGELGVSQFGARAVGEEMRISSERASEGLCLTLTAPLNSQIVAPIYVRNGWDLRRMATVQVSGFGDPNIIRVILEAMRDGALQPSPAIEQKLYRDLGIGT